MQTSYYLHEMPIVQRVLLRYRCRRKGGHKPFYVGRTFLGYTPFDEKQYCLHYVCEHCRKDLSHKEYER